MSKNEARVAAALFLVLVFLASFFATSREIKTDDKKRQEVVTLRNQVEELKEELAYAEAVHVLWQAETEKLRQACAR